MKKLAVVAVVLASAACTRDLQLPGLSAFEVSASPTTVAPRQTSTLSISGGTGSVASFTVDFDAGGRLSGDDASVLNNGDGTATYTAGRNGSTQDTILVRDTAGAERRVIITVGPRLTITPQVGAAAPGGSVTFVASGGKAPYAFDVVLANGTVSRAVPLDPLDPTRGVYTAGTDGDVEEYVRVTDATGDLAASTTATVRVGTRLQLYRPTTGPVAPSEEVTLIAFGGRSPYTFGPSCASAPPPLDCFPDPSKGIMKVGDLGWPRAPALATVTDANLQTASVGLDVGAPLTARLATPLVRPGIPNRIAASGGKQPYAFRFASRGNHSGGQVDSVSGAYVPGPSPGAVDRLEVEDATGTVAALSGVAPVGPLEIATGRDGDRCVAGDFDGDGTGDLAFLFRGMSLLEVNRIASDPLYRTYYVGDGFMFPAAFPADFDLDRREELHFVGSRSGGPTYVATGVTRDLGYWVLDPDMTGLFGNPDGMMTSPFSCNLGTPYAEDVAGVHYEYFLTDQTADCGSALRRVLWVNGGAALTSCSPPVANLGALGSATALVAGDFSGDGLADFAWLGSSTDYVYANTWNTPGPIHLRYMSAGSFADGGSLSLPAGTIYEGLGNGEQARALRVPARPGTTAEGLLVRLRDNKTGQGVIAFATGQPLAWRYTGFDPFGAAGGASALALFTPYPGGPPLAAAFAGSSGKVAVFDPWAADPTLTMGVGEAAFPVSYGCSVDADADGFPDLAAGGADADLAVLLWGDGTGAFGTRARLAAGMGWGVSGDLDGDGLVDLVTSDGQSLAAMFGDTGQLGWGDAPITTRPIAGLAVARFVDQGSGALAPRDSIFFQSLDGDYYVVRTHADGTFEPELRVLADSGAQQNVPRVAHGWLVPADLGGLPGMDGTGPDLIAPENDNYGHSWVHLLFRKNETASLQEHVSPVVGDYRFNTPPGVIDKTHQCAFAGVRTGTDRAVAALCAFEVPAGQPAARWRVRGWPISWSSGWYDLPWQSVGTGGDNAGAAGTESAMAAIGTFGGKAYFVVATDRLWLARVDPGASALSPSGWTVTTTQLTAARRTTPYMVQLADFDADGDLDAVVGGEGMTLLLENQPDGAVDRKFVYRTEIPAAGFPVLAGPLGFIDAGKTIPEGPSVVLAGLSGAGGLQILRTDGAGGLK